MSKNVLIEDMNVAITPPKDCPTPDEARGKMAMPGAIYCIKHEECNVYHCSYKSVLE